MSIANKINPRGKMDAARALLTAARARSAPALAWIAEHAPVVGYAAQRQRNRIVLPPYKRSYTLQGTIINILLAPILATACLVYGFFFGLTAPFLIVAFVVPIVVLTALIIWALPDQRSAPTLAIEILFPAFFVSQILWPNYLAVTLPGLPWITVLRIIGLPMAALLLISLSVSPYFRKRISDSVNSIQFLWIFIRAFIFIQIVTIILSPSPGASAQVIFNQQISWTCVFVISCVLFRDTKYVERYLALLCALSIPIMLVTTLESKGQHVLWAAHIPAILRVPDPSVQITLAPSFRPGINFYRAKATFSTPLGQAEYLSLLTPFLLHFGFTAKRTLWKVVAFAMIPAIFITIRNTDARLGIAGMLVSVLLYGLMWSIVRWRSHPRDLFAAATVYAYPALFAMGIGAVYASTRLNQMVFGGGAQASSSAARDNQLGMALAKLWAAPWGHGTGQSGNAMGYAEGAFITIDNYFITIALDYGILGIVLWYGIFIIAMVEAVRYSLSARYAGREEAKLLAPLAVAIAAFLIIKWVHGQDDNHSILFMMLGMVSALIYKLRNETPVTESVGSADNSPVHADSKRLAPVAREPTMEPARYRWPTDHG